MDRNDFEFQGLSGPPREATITSRPDPTSAQELARPLVRRYILARVRSREDAEDLVQDVLLATHRYLDSFRGDCQFEVYVLRICTSRLKNYYRARNGKPQIDDWDDSPYEPQHMHSPGCLDDRVVLRDQALELLRHMREVCSPVERSVLMMHWKGMNSREIARVTKMNDATVRSHILRGRGRLLSQVLLNDPGLLGGDEAIESAIKKAVSQPTPVLSENEVAAIRSRDRSDAFTRTAIVKLAPFLPLCTLAIFLLVADLR